MTPPAPVLKVLGVPALHGPDGEPIPFRVRKHFALLIYLALEPQVHRREKLAALLWPQATTAEARHSLATGLSVLRAKLGREALETSRETIRLLGGTLEIDLDRLARGEIHATETQPALAVAPLLQEFVVPDAGPWDHWREGLRAKWHPAVRDALVTRIDRSRRQGNTRAMEVLADALLSLDDLSEEGVRAKMESRAFAGDRLSALQLYESWKLRLSEELGAQPSELLAGMALRLKRRGWERTSGEHIPAVRTDQWKDRPFIGRATEYEAIYNGWEGSAQGRARHALITGESGVGKTTLMERLTTAAGLQGAVSARVQCHEVEREIPYGTIGTLIGLLLDKPGATAVAPEWLAELGRTVSAVRRRFPNAVPSGEVTGEMVRIRLADAFHELVRAIAEEQPVILVMDDIHLSDDASVAVMHLLLRRLTEERVLVLCTLRQSEAPLGPSARGMLERAEIANMSVVPLQPLTEAESTELLAHLVPEGNEPPSMSVRRALLRAASGLPMLLELLLRDWQVHGERCVGLAIQAMTEELRTAGGAGETYKRLLIRLTTDLEPTTRSVLNLAAVLGSQLNDFALYALVDLTMPHAMSGLSALAALRILRDDGQGLDFVNEVMRGEVYQAVPSSVRKALHSKVADRLTVRASAGEEMLGLAIAWHCIRSGRADEAGEWLVDGGRAAIAQSALAEAEDALQSGWKHLRGPAAIRSGTLLAEVLLDQYRFAEAALHLASLSTSNEVVRTVEQDELMRFAHLGRQMSETSDHEGILAGLEAIAESSDDSLMRLRAGVLATSLSSLALADPISEKVLAMLQGIRHVAPPRHFARIDLLSAQTHFWLGHIDTTERILDGIRESGPIDGPALHQFNLHLGLGAINVTRGRYNDSLGYAYAAAALAARAGSQVKEGTAIGNAAIVLLRLGDTRSARAAAERALGLIGTTDHTSARVNALGVLCYADAWLGDPVAAERSLLALDQARDELSSLVLRYDAELWHADTLFLLGRTDQAMIKARQIMPQYRSVSRGNVGRLARWAGHIVMLTSDQKSLEALRYAFTCTPKVDRLDQLEIATNALAHLRLTAEEEQNAKEIALTALRDLPQTAVRQLLRLGLLLPLGMQLPEHAHPPA